MKILKLEETWTQKSFADFDYKVNQEVQSIEEKSKLLSSIASFLSNGS